MAAGTIVGPLGRRPPRLRAVRLGAARMVGGLATAMLRRGFDLTLAAGLLVLLAPFLVVRVTIAHWHTGRVLDRAPRVGRFRTRFERLAFAGPQPGRSLAVLVNVLRGDMAFAGPRALDEIEATLVPMAAGARFEVRPGLVSPHRLRRWTATAHEPEAVADREFVYAQTLSGDLGLVARALPGALLGGHARSTASPELEFFGVRVVNTTMDEAIDWIVARAGGGDPALLAFVNPHCLNTAYVDPAYRTVLRTAARVLPDGIGLHLGCRLLGTSLAGNVNGTDLFPRLCERLAGTDQSLFLLGARPGVADAAARAMQVRCPGLRVAGTRDGYFGPDDEDAVIDEINRSGADVLLVAFGVPAQELWLARHHDRLRPPVRMAVGGLFDFFAGRIPRAPAWMREIGLEWAWRLAQEPGRMWRRYLIGNPLFLYRVWRQASGRHGE